MMRFRRTDQGRQAAMTALAGLAGLTLLAASTAAGAMAIDGETGARAPTTRMAAEMDGSPPPPRPRAELLVYSPSAAELLDRFARLGYSYEEVVTEGSPVPRIRVLSVPEDIADIPDVDDRKALFFKILLPLVLQENDRILNERREIQILQALSGSDPESLSEERRERLDELLQRYRMDEADIDELLLRADIIPPSLALAQAAIESGWGSSRFAQEGNALYGQITTATDALVSRSQTDGSPMRFAAFGDIAQATVSYMRNLNTHPAYRPMRALRADLGARGESVTGTALAEGLLSYSERGGAYVAFVQQIIRINDLHLADETRLAPSTQLAATPPEDEDDAPPGPPS